MGKNELYTPEFRIKKIKNELQIAVKMPSYNRFKQMSSIPIDDLNKIECIEKLLKETFQYGFWASRELLTEFLEVSDEDLF